jgi:hypothetical protein
MGKSDLEGLKTRFGSRLLTFGRAAGLEFVALNPDRRGIGIGPDNTAYGD